MAYETLYTEATLIKQTDSKDMSALISADQLHSISTHNNLKIFDVRGTWKTPARSLYDDYLSQHIPGAIFLDWTKDFLQQHAVLNLAQVCHYQAAKQSFANLGINKEDLVVVYDDYHHMFSGRIWWAMKYWGFENVKVLNGGLSHWLAQGLPTSSEIPKVCRGSYEPICNDALRISMDDFLIAKDESIVVDGRSSEGYAGNPEDPRTGHIPNAINVSYKNLLDKSTGLFLEASKIEDVFNNLTPNWRSKAIISSCGAGYSGTVPMIALQELGTPSCLFDESFAVWKQEPARAVEQS